MQENKNYCCIFIFVIFIFYNEKTLSAKFLFVILIIGYFSMHMHVFYVFLSKYDLYFACNGRHKNTYHRKWVFTVLLKIMILMSVIIIKYVKGRRKLSKQLLEITSLKNYYFFLRIINELRSFSHILESVRCTWPLQIWH